MFTFGWKKFWTEEKNYITRFERCIRVIGGGENGGRLLGAVGGVYVGVERVLLFFWVFEKP